MHMHTRFNSCLSLFIALHGENVTVAGILTHTQAVRLEHEHEHANAGIYWPYFTHTLLMHVQALDEGGSHQIVVDQVDVIQRVSELLKKQDLSKYVL